LTPVRKFINWNGTCGSVWLESEQQYCAQSEHNELGDIQGHTGSCENSNLDTSKGGWGAVGWGERTAGTRAVKSRNGGR